MSSTIIFPTILILATLFCALVAGLLFGFAIVTMPGIKTLQDGEFLRAFQVMDRVIQNNQPFFMVVWLGSMVTLLAAVGLGFGQMAGADRALLVTAALVYFLGVQLPTIRFNIPLNNGLQTVQVDALSAAEQAAVRAGFEPRWNRWNAIRTLFAILAVVLLMVLQFRLAL